MNGYGNILISPTLVWLSVTMVTMLIFVPECIGAASCPITRQANDGPETHAIVKFSNCNQMGASSTPSCGAVEKEVTLVKGVTKDIG